MAPHLRIYLLGDFRLGLADEAIFAIQQARQQALLTYLLLHRQAPQVRRHLAFLLWPDSSEVQALTNLRKTLTHLRQLTPILAQAIYTDHQVVQWRPNTTFTLDVAEFETKLVEATAAEQAGRVQEAFALWAAAVAHYTGPLTPSCYDDWLITERERLHQRCIGALERLVAGHERQHEPAAAIPYAQHLLRLDPLQETAYLQLMRLQALVGDGAAALRTYHTCVTVLARELGVEPAAEIQAAYRRLMKRETGRQVTARTPTMQRMVGRQHEWAKLQQSWKLATTHGARFVCIWGEAGIGKSHLAAELLHWAGQQGFTVAHTRAYAGEGQLVYAPVIEWLRAEAIQSIRSRLAAVWLSEVARLTPEILSELPTVPPPAPLTEGWQRQRFWEALARTLLAAAQPMLLVIDDLQWCDIETLEWLRYLLHFASKARLLIVGTARLEEVEVTHPVQTLCRHLRAAEQFTGIDLTALTAEQTALLATQVAQQPLDDRSQAALYQATTGNPLFVVEMVRAGLGERIRDQSRVESASLVPLPFHDRLPLPPKMQAIISSRLAQLSPTARDLARLAAVIGQDFTFDLLLQASDDDEAQVVRGLDELWQRRILNERGAHTYDFSHDRIREVAYSEISPVRRRQLHRQIAVVMAQHRLDDFDKVSGMLAFHYEQAGLLAQAAQAYQQTGHIAQERYAYQEAYLYLQKSLTLLRALPVSQQTKEQELELLISLTSILHEIKGFATPEVGKMYNQALSLCQLVGSQVQRYLIQNGLRLYYGNRSEWALAHKLAEDALALAQQIPEAGKIPTAHHGLGIVYLALGKFAEALEQFELSMKLSTSGQMQNNQTETVITDPLSLIQSALCLWLLGYPEQARQHTQAGLTQCQIEVKPPVLTIKLYFALMTYHLLHDSDQII